MEVENERHQRHEVLSNTTKHRSPQASVTRCRQIRPNTARRRPASRGVVKYDQTLLAAGQRHEVSSNTTTPLYTTVTTQGKRSQAYFCHPLGVLTPSGFFSLTPCFLWPQTTLSLPFSLHPNTLFCRQAMPTRISFVFHLLSFSTPTQPHSAAPTTILIVRAPYNVGFKAQVSLLLRSYL
jgi:hypothetical protein